VVRPENLFKAMADATRQRALQVLKGQELSVSELVEVLGQPQSTVSRHLRTLRNADLIRDRRDGATVLYSVPKDDAGNGASDLPRHLLAWVDRQPLPDSLAERLDVVLDRRRDMSARFFDRVGRHWDNLREASFGKTFHLEALIALLPSDWIVADIGAGTGYLLPALAGQFRHVIGVEPVDRMIDISRQRVELLGLNNVDLRKGDLARLPISPEAVDLAIAMLVLHHVPSPRAALGELHRILRGAGQVLIVEQAAHEDEGFRDRMQDGRWGFDRDELTAWVRSAGFADSTSRVLLSADRSAGTPELFIVTGNRGQQQTQEREMGGPEQV